MAIFHYIIFKLYSIFVYFFIFEKNDYPIKSR